MIESSWSGQETVQKKKKEIKKDWKKIEKTISGLDTKYKNHIQFIENKAKSKDNIIFLQKLDSSEYKKLA